MADRKENPSDPKEPFFPLGHDLMEQMNGFFKGNGKASLFHSMDSFFQKTYPFNRSIPIDMYETSREWVIQAELPGVERDRIEVEAFGDKVHISVTDHQEHTVENDQQHYFHRERRFHQAERTITLPYMVSPDEIRASFHHGVLELRGRKIPKKNQSVPLE